MLRRGKPQIVRMTDQERIDHLAGGRVTTRACWCFGLTNLPRGGHFPCLRGVPVIAGRVLRRAGYRTLDQALAAGHVLRRKLRSWRTP